MGDIGFLNGVFMPLEEARVSVEDRGFQFGDGVYEVVRTYRGRPFHLDLHLQRFERSAKALDLALPYSTAQWRDYIQEGMARAGYAESKVYLQVTRGVAPRDHGFPVAVQPTAVMTIRELRPLVADLQAAGVAAMTTEDLRWGRCDIKSVNLLANVLARQRAREAGVFEAIFVRQGIVTEGSVSNVLMVKGGRIRTPPEGPMILSGVTRQIVLDLARAEGITVEECEMALDEFRAADEICLTGTTVEVLPVVRLDGVPIGHGRPGPVSLRLLAAFQREAGVATLLHQ
ncbi:D-amino-acid transaminase [Candidatus Nitrospira bockiana]